MTGFDIFVFLVVGVAAVGGFMRGFVQEVLSLAAWAVAIVAIKFLHTDFTVLLVDVVGTTSGAAVLAFASLMLVPYFAVKLIAAKAGKSSRNSVLGPIDRVLGFGFGAVKGVIVVVMAFSVLVLVYDSIWGPAGRPSWLTTSRTYPFINASADEMVLLIKERQDYLTGDTFGEGAADSSL